MRYRAETLPWLGMSLANQHSDLLFDFGPRGSTGEGARFDWVPNAEAESASPVLPVFSFSSTEPLPPTPSKPVVEPAPVVPTSSKTQFWLDGDVLMCLCPDCRAPMTVRLWLMSADCWNCGTSILLDDEQIQAAERTLKSSRAASTVPKTPTVLAPEKTVPVPTLEPPPLPAKKEGATSTTAPPATTPVRKRVPLKPEKRVVIPPVMPVEDDSFLDAVRATLRDTPAWLLSFIVHTSLLILLALVIHPEQERGPTILLTANIWPERKEGGEVLHLPEFDKAKFDLPIPNKQDLNDPKKREALLAANQEARELRLSDGEEQRLPDLDAVKSRLTSANGVHSAMAARDPRLRAEVATQEGGTTLTEAAVARALRWFSRHQNAEGSWSIHDHRQPQHCSCSHEGDVHDDTAGTALALLPFLGAGQSHLLGRYQSEVAGGLRWLILHQKPDGDLRVNTSNSGMYAHGQAAIVLCEAFAMTGDEELRTPAQKAIDFIVQAQYNDGGWRYTPSPRNQQGDTSVVGWQLMALQSARAAKLNVPEQTFARVNAYLDRVQHDDGATYAYQRGNHATPTMTAEGLLCRLYLGWTKDRSALHQGIEHLAKHPPRHDDLGIYYWYYATQTMHHFGGPKWDDWNVQMRNLLVESQQKDGHAAGSWIPVGQHSSSGGRIFATSLSACTLEVYYRHLPIFRQIKVEEE